MKVFVEDGSLFIAQNKS